jgi:excisionase family DNA binding protein
VTVTKLNTTVVLTVAQVAELTQVSEWNILRQIKAGRLRAKEIGGCKRITRADFDAWLAADSDASAEDGSGPS